MSRLFTFICIFISVSLISLSRSYGLTGGADIGGGLGLICFDSQRAADSVFHQSGLVDDGTLASVTSVEPIDLVEARWIAEIERPRARLLMAGENENDKQFLQRIFSHIEDVIPQLADRLRESQASMTESFLDQALPLMADAGLPDEWNQFERCALATLAIQDMYSIRFDRRLYARMDATGKAVLKLHEYMYRIGRIHGHEHSSPTRFILKYLLRTNLGEHKEIVKRLLVNNGFFNSGELH